MKSLRVEQEGRITYLVVPKTAMWSDAQTEMATLERVGIWDVDFVKLLEDDCGVVADCRTDSISVSSCHLVKRVNGEWIRPSECKLSWNEGRGRELSADLESFVDGFRPVPHLQRVADGVYLSPKQESE